MAGMRAVYLKLFVWTNAITWHNSTAYINTWLLAIKKKITLFLKCCFWTIFMFWKCYTNVHINWTELNMAWNVRKQQNHCQMKTPRASKVTSNSNYWCPILEVSSSDRQCMLSVWWRQPPPPKINIILGNFTSGRMALTYNHHSAALRWKRVARYPSNRVGAGCFSWEAEIEILLLKGPGLWPLKPTPQYDHKFIWNKILARANCWTDLASKSDALSFSWLDSRA